jgi:membrane peptidoglycan carboxypeptidase
MTAEASAEPASGQEVSDAPAPQQESQPSKTAQQEQVQSKSWAHVRRGIKWTLFVAVFATLGWGVHRELSSSTLQAAIFSDFAREARFHTRPGPSDTVRFPAHGPFNERLGYTRLEDISGRLVERGFRISEQARLSQRSLELFDRGLFLPYWPQTRSGLQVWDTNEHVVHASRYPTRAYDDFESIPSLVVDALLHIENRSLLNPSEPTFNPALEWRRFARASLEVGWAEMGGAVDPDGASTLATQIEKYRHSPGGQTNSYDDKIDQMASASLRAYRDGPTTLGAQKQVVRTYVNSVPLSAVPGFGEVRGIGDGLHAWYGADLGEVSRLLDDVARSKDAARSNTDLSHPEVIAQAHAFRRVLSLFVAQRRPSYFLAQEEGQDRLEAMTDFYLRDLADHGLISAGFRDVALAQASGPFRQFVDDEQEPFWTKKFAHSLRVDLLEATGAPSLYELDRYDLDVGTTIDQDVQHAVETTLQRLADPDFVADQGLDSYRLLDKGDPAEVIYSVTLYEKTPTANLLRVQADTFDQPFNINEGMKLNLGSTAKLRTLASYLSVLATLHDELAGLTGDELDQLDVHRSDRLSRWAIDFLRTQQEPPNLNTMLEAAMGRRYSANPTERFFTGGGIHRFSNFNHKYDHTSPTVRFALEKSINLVFVRMMRDIVRFHMFRQKGVSPKILNDDSDPHRRDYLERFADYEGKVFLADFYRRYKDDTPRQTLIRLFKSRKWSPKKFMTALRAIRPDMDIYTVHALVEEQFGDRKFGVRLDRELVQDMYDSYGPDRYDLNDQGYVSGVHPLELWLLGYRKDHPDPTWGEVVQASKKTRQYVYEWLFKTSRKHAQDQRIQIMMEQDAFEPIHREWQRFGYPFDELVPSYATSIGSSADRPAALAELVGIIVNEGKRLPRVRFTSMHFAQKTPYETRFERVPEAPEQVMAPEVAHALRDALIGVATDGTAHRLQNYEFEIDGQIVDAGGKTGTGDNRHTIRNRHGRVVDSVARNRTATFVFFLGDRFFGTITAFVPGEQADEYHFTSGLAVSVLGMLSPKLEPLWQEDASEQGVLAGTTPGGGRSAGPHENRGFRMGTH